MGLSNYQVQNQNSKEQPNFGIRVTIGGKSVTPKRVRNLLKRIDYQESPEPIMKGIKWLEAQSSELYPKAHINITKSNEKSYVIASPKGEFNFGRGPVEVGVCSKFEENLQKTFNFLYTGEAPDGIVRLGEENTTQNGHFFGELDPFMWLRMLFTSKKPK